MHFRVDASRRCSSGMFRFPVCRFVVCVGVLCFLVCVGCLFVSHRWLCRWYVVPYVVSSSSVREGSTVLRMDD